MKKNYIALLLVVLLSGCASKTTVILLPDDDGTVGSVIVRGEESEVELKTAYSASKVGGGMPSEAKKNDKALIDSKYSRVLAAQPEKPQSFILHFLFDSSELTRESKIYIPEIIEAVKNRKPATVSIIAHSDRAGDTEYNMKLSKKRAQAVEELFLHAGLKRSSLFIEYHGEYYPIFPTADGIADLRNRRVEVMVR
jgi:outer membrane protein OmpA-like peptidoglycan-associated protein